jgi:hypothetical protein
MNGGRSAGCMAGITFFGAGIEQGSVCRHERRTAAFPPGELPDARQWRRWLRSPKHGVARGVAVFGGSGADTGSLADALANCPTLRSDCSAIACVRRIGRAAN